MVFLYLHSILRYFVLFLLIFVIIKSLMGWLGKQPFTNADDKLSLFLLIFTHLQLVAGAVLYFLTPVVQFSQSTMKDPVLRYWTVEHASMMLIAIALITIARITHKKLPSAELKFKRLFIYNTLALLIIVAAIMMSHRGLFHSVVFS